MAPSDRILVLYIDDDPSLLELVKEWLEMDDEFIIETAESGAVGLERLRSSSFDAVICDYQMPGMDGIEVLSSIRRMWAALPFILFTGKGREEVVIEALNQGADGYLQKGGDPRAQFTELRHKLLQAVNIHRSKVLERESEERFESLFNYMSSGSAIYEVRNDGASGGDYIVRDFNRKALEIEGKTRSEVVGRSLRDLRPNIDEYGLIQVFQNVWRTGEPAYYPAKIYVDEKYYNWYDNTVFRLPSGEIVAIYNDVTDRVRSEEDLQDREKKFRAIVESSPMAMYFYHLEPDDRLVLDGANPAADRIVGISHSSLIGLTIEEAFPNLAPTPIPEMYRKVAKGETGPQMFDIPYQDERFSGWYDVTVFRTGERGIAVDFVDRSERMRTEKALRESEERFRIISENIPDHVFIQDQDLRYTWVLNPQLGLSHSDMVGKTDQDIVGRDEAEALTKVKREVMRSGKPVKYSTSLESIHGNREIFDGVYVPKFDGDGKIVGIIGYFRNVTKIVQAEESLLRANKKLNLLSSVTRHDAMNNIAAIGAYAEMLRSKGLGKAEAEYVDKILGRTEIIQHQLDFTRIYQGIGERRPVWINVQDTLQEILETLPLGELAIEQKGLNVDVFADPMFERGVYNLIENCLRHGGSAKHMEVSAFMAGGELKLVFQDDGVGISPEEHEHLFQRGHGKNTGFGLFLTREILEITGMSIVENSAPGKGARFEITVPPMGWRTGHF